MNTVKRQKIDPDQYTMFHGKETYEVEVPFAEDIDLWVDWLADRDVCVWLYYVSGKRIPYASGLKGHFNVQSSNVLSVVFQCTKSTTVLACVSYKDLARTDKLDYTPVAISPPPPAQLQLAALMDEAVTRRLQDMGVLKIDVDDEDNLEDEDEDEGFGPGFMEEEEPRPKPFKPAAKPGSSNDSSGERSGGKSAGVAGTGAETVSDAPGNPDKAVAP